MKSPWVLCALVILLIICVGCSSTVVDTTEEVVDEPEEGVVEDMDTEEVDDTAELEAGSTAETSTIIIKIHDFTFDPAEVVVTPGTTVTWVQEDEVKHTATSDTGLFDSPLLEKGEKFSYTFNEEGEFGYYCKPHPNMIGSVIVE